MSYKDLNRFNHSKRRYEKGDLNIEGMTFLFEYFKVRRIDNFNLPTKAKQKEYNEFSRWTGKKTSRSFMKSFTLKTKNTTSHYKSLLSLCDQNNLYYSKIYRLLRGKRLIAIDGYTIKNNSITK